MSIDPGPHDLNTIRFILGPDGTGTTKADSPTFYQELDTDFKDFSGHLLVSRHSFDSSWPTWEMHPHGDEFVYLLEGDTDFVLSEAGTERRIRINRPGDYLVVPKGAWHIAHPHAPTTMLFVTPGDGTLNQETPG